MPLVRFQRSPHARGEPARRFEHAAYLGETFQPVRQELQALLAQAEIEDARRKRHLESARTMPLVRYLHAARHLARDFDTARVDVEADHFSRDSNVRCSHARGDTGAAGDIEKLLAGPWPCMV